MRRRLNLRGKVYSKLVVILCLLIIRIASTGQMARAEKNAGSDMKEAIGRAKNPTTLYSTRTTQNRNASYAQVQSPARHVEGRDVKGRNRENGPIISYAPWYVEGPHGTAVIDCTHGIPCKIMRSVLLYGSTHDPGCLIWETYSGYRYGTQYCLPPRWPTLPIPAKLRDKK